MDKLPLSQMKYIRTLIVDDDNFSLRIIRHILYGLGVEKIEEAFNGVEAVEKLRQCEFDLLITDIEMPKMNGLELVKQLRCGLTCASRSLATIVITNLSETELLGSLLALDVNGFLSKPIKQIWVHEKITKAMTEGGFIQPVKSYENVITSFSDLRKKSPKKYTAAPVKVETRHPNPPAPTQPHVDDSHVLVRNLKPGMILKSNLHLRDGTLLLKKEYKLTASTINRLQDIRLTLESEILEILPDVDTEVLK